LGQQHFLYFIGFPFFGFILPQGQGSFLPTFWLGGGLLGEDFGREVDAGAEREESSGSRGFILAFKIVLTIAESMVAKSP